jgi:short subunit dehydrogenase-like uncharacterized protein
MAARIVLFGATGYTGRLTAAALVARGHKPLLVARGHEAVRDLARELGGLEWVLADVSDPSSLRAALNAGDVLISTVGPFVRWGDTAAQAAIDAGAHYIDSTGEPVFVRRVFERFGPQARGAGVGMLTSIGADWVPGNLAGALALREAGDAPARVEIGYYVTGRSGGAPAISGGTRASAAGALLEPGFAFRDGAIVTEAGGLHTLAFEVTGRTRPALSVAASEQFTLPRLAPTLREVDVYLGTFGSATGTLHVLSRGVAAGMRVPGVQRAFVAAASRLMKGSTGGPDADERAKTGMHTVAVARDAQGAQLSAVHVAGPNVYDFTAGILAWTAITALQSGLRDTGALGPVDAFGLEVLQAGCREVGLARV